MIRNLILVSSVVWLGCVPSFAADGSVALQRKVDALSEQLHMTSRFDSSATNHRYDELAAALAAWKESARGDAELAVMQQWLDEAMRSALPGRRRALPPAPVFPERVVEAPPAVPEEEIPAPQEPSVAFDDTPIPVVETQPIPVVEPVQPKEPENEIAATPPTIPTPQAIPTLPVSPSEPVETPMEESIWQDHPAREPIALVASDPFVDDPEPSEAPSQPERTTAMRPTTFAPVERVVDQPLIRTAELTARLNGYELGLASLEGRLLRNESPSSDELLLYARELVQLKKQREFVVLYLSSLTAAERARVDAPSKLDTTKRAIEAKLDSRKQSSESIDDILFQQRDEAAEAAAELLNSI